MAAKAMSGATAATAGSGRRYAAHGDVIVGIGGLLLLFGYAIIEFVRPQIYFGAIAQAIRPALVLTILITLYWLRQWGPKELVGDRVLLCAFLFALFGTLWVPFAANNFWAFQTATTQWLLLTAATVPMSLLLVAPARRRQYLAFWIFMNAYLALFVIANGGRGPGGIMEDENDMAFTFCMAIPYPFFLAQCSTNKPLVRGMYYGITLLMLAAVVATHSRGGFLGVACVAAYGIYLSRNRLRKILVLITIGVVALQFVPDSYFDRIGSISDTSDSSRVERLKSWRIGWNIFVDNPVLGVGPSNYGTHSPPYHMALPDYVPGEPLLGGRAAHSLYFTLLPEGGLVGAGIYAMLIIGLFRGLRQSERIASSAVAAHSEAESDLLLARAARASLIGYLAAGAFISILYYPHLWYTIGIVIALSRDVRRRYGQHHAPASTTLRRSPVKA